MTTNQGIQANRARMRTRHGNVINPAPISQLPDETKLSPGLSIWSGQVKEEYLTSLTPWSRAIKIYKEMQDDVIIGALFESITTPLIASPFEVAAASDSAEDMKAKEFVEQNLFLNPNFEWQNHVDEMLEYMAVGFAISEKVLEKEKDGRLHLRDLIPIGQDSLERWGPLDGFGRTTAFQQRDNGGQVRTAEMDKLLHFTFRERKRNPEGRGILRSLYRPWYFKKNLETLEAIGVERDVGNAPVVSLKENVRYSAQDLTKLQEALEGFRMDEALYVILPGGASLDAYGGGNKVYNVREIIRDWQHLIRQRFFADFLAFGSESVGTQALAREMTTFFGLALRSVQESMLSVWNRQLIPWLFKWNNWPLEHLPVLEWLKPGETNIQSLAQSYSMLVQNQLVDVNDPELRARVRTQLGLKKKNTPDEKVIVNPQKGNQTPFDKSVMSADFADLEGGELTDTVLEFFNSVISLVLENKLGITEGLNEINQVERDTVLKVSGDDLARVNRMAQVSKSIISNRDLGNDPDLR